MRLKKGLQVKLKKRYYIYFKSIFNKIKHHYNQRNNKFAIIQFASLGDTALLISSCKILSESNYNFDVICSQDKLQIWKTFFPKNKIISLEKIWNDSYIKEKLESLETNNYQSIFCTSIDIFSCYLSTHLNSNKRFGLIEVGKYYKGSKFIFNKVYKSDKNEHVLQRYINLFSLAGIKLNKLFGKFATDSNKNYILIHPGAKWKLRRWSEEKFFSLAEKISNKVQRTFIVVHESEDELFKFFQNKIPKNNYKIFLAKTKNYQQLLKLIKNCNTMIGNDSGPIHLANLLSKKCLIIWGPGNLKRVRPLGNNIHIIKKEVNCRPCKQYISDEYCQNGENICLTKISCDEVYDKFMKISETAQT